MINLAKKLSCNISWGISTFFSFAGKLQVQSIEFSNLNAALCSGRGRSDNNGYCPAVFFEKSAGKTTFRYLEDGEIESTLTKSVKSIAKIFNGSLDNLCGQYYNADASGIR